MMVIHGTPKKRRLLYFPTKQCFCFKSVQMCIYIYRTIYTYIHWHTIIPVLYQWFAKRTGSWNPRTFIFPLPFQRMCFDSVCLFSVQRNTPTQVQLFSDPNQMLVSGAHPKHFNQGLREIPRDTAGLRFRFFFVYRFSLPANIPGWQNGFVWK